MAITNASGTIGTTGIMSNWTTTTVASIAEIKGTPIYAQVEKSKFELEDRIVADYEIKIELCDLLVKKLLENNAIEFTKEENFSMDTVICRARIFATPKDQVQLLRVNKTIP
jgi:hypothetical protein